MAFIEKQKNKKSTAWRVRYKGTDGKEHQKSFRSLRDAQAFKKTTEADVIRGEWWNPRRQTAFDAWVEKWQAESTNRRETTRSRDRYVIRRWLVPEFGARPLGSISPRDVQKLILRMAESLQPATVKTNVGILRAIMREAVDAGEIKVSPCDRRLRLPKDERKDQQRFLTPEELTRLGDAIPDEYEPMVWLGALMGLRWSEVAGLKVKAVNFLRAELTVTETLAEVEGRKVVAPPKSVASKATLTMPPALVDMLAAHLAKYGRTDPDAYVFQTPSGRPLSGANFRQRVWGPALKKAGIEHCGFHALRHTCVALLVDAGTHPILIQRRMRHSSFTITANVYGRILPSNDREAATALDRLLQPSTGDAQTSS